LNKVKIDGYGTFEVDGEITGQVVDEIVASINHQRERNAITHKSDKAASAGKSILDNIIKPITRVGEIYQEETSSGLKSMTEGSKLEKLGGLFQYVFSPITAFGKGIAGEPLGDVTEERFITAGADPNTAAKAGQFVEDAATIASTIAGPGTYGKVIFKDAPTAIAGPLKYFMDDTTQVLKAKPTVTKSDDVSVKKADDVDEIETIVNTTDRGRVPHLSLATQEDIIVGVEKAVAANLNNSERLYKAVSRELMKGLETDALQLDQIFPLLDKYGISPEQFAGEYATTVSEAGASLQKLSALAKRIAQMSDDLSPQMKAKIQEIAEDMEDGKTGVDTLLGAFSKVENARRAMLVGQLATAMRNAISQAGRLTIGMVDDMIAGGMRGNTGKESLKNVWDATHSHFKALSAFKDKELLKKIFDGSPITESMLMNRTVHEVEQVNKVLKAVNFFNTTQEKMFRRIAFEARLREHLKSVGKNLDEIDPRKIPAEFLSDAVKYAHEISFAAEAKGKAARALISAWSKIPGLTTVNPFPRFAFANALPFITQHSPLGFVKALSPATLKKLSQGNPEEFVKASSRAMLGTMFLGSAMEIRSGNMPGVKPGEKWYEIEVRDKTYDLRAFAPFSTYLLIAEFINNRDKLSASDYAQAAVGLNRVSGTGLVLVDAIRSRDPEVSGQTLKNWLGQYAASFTVPIRTIKDFYTIIDPEGEKYRDLKGDTSGENFVNPILGNLPKFDQLVAEARSPLRVGAITPESSTIFGLEIPGSVFRQITGLIGKKKNPIEKEIDRLNLDYLVYRPKTGIREADRYISSVMAKVVTVTIPKVLESEKYQNLTDAQKRWMLAQLFTNIKTAAREHTVQNEPDLAFLLLTKGVGKREAAMIEEINNINIRDVKEMRNFLRGN